MMKPYSSYKESGLEWIGRIPVEWKTNRISHFFIERKEKVDDRSYPPLSVTMNGIQDQLKRVAKTDNNDNRKKVCKGDFVINSRSDRKGSSGISFRDGSVSIINTVLEPMSIHPPFVHYLFKSYPFVEEFFRHGKGIHFDLWSTKYTTMKNIEIPNLSLSEQKQIVSFLDHKTQLIDELIEKTEKKIELLKEKRTSLINHCVTKGLKPNVEMKDSGVEWIGEIPSHWGSTRLKYIGFLYGGLSGKSGKDFNQDDNPNNRPFIPFTNISDNTHISNSQFGRVVVLENEEQNVVRQFDLFFLMSSETQEDVGKTSVLKDDIGEIYLNSFCKGFRVTDEKYSPSFLNYLLSGHSYRELLSVEGKGFTRINLRTNKVNDLELYSPPLPEQHQIVEFLDKQTQKIDSTVEKETQRMELLKEYRQSLISEAVTGKIDVRKETIV